MAPSPQISTVGGHASGQSNLEGVAKGSLRLADSASAEASLFIAAIHGAMLAARAAGNALVFREIAQQSTQRLRVPSQH